MRCENKNSSEAKKIDFCFYAGNLCLNELIGCVKFWGFHENWSEFSSDINSQRCARLLRDVPERDNNLNI